MTWLSMDSAENIRDFGMAVWHYENCKPIRSINYHSKEVDGVPLMAHRRDWAHKSLHKIDDDTYGFRLYDTDVVTISRNGNIGLDLSWGSATTDAWASHWLFNLTGRHIGIHSEKKAIDCSWGWVDDDQHNHYTLNVAPSRQQSYAVFYTDTESFIFEPLDKSYQKVHIHNVAPRFVKRINRTGAHDARKPLQPLVEYLKVFSAMPMREETVNELNTEWRERADGWHRSASQAEFHKQDWRYHNMQYQRVYEMSNMDTIKKHLYSMMYDKEGLSGFRQLALGETINATVYTHQDVKHMENSDV
jgi:hypothetical protein